MEKKNKILSWIFAIGLIIAISVAYFGTQYSFNSKDVQATDDEYWNVCSKENTSTSYAKYLIQFPDGIHSNEAQTRMNELSEISD